MQNLKKQKHSSDPKMSKIRTLFLEKQNSSLFGRFTTSSIYPIISLFRCCVELLLSCVGEALSFQVLSSSF